MRARNLTILVAVAAGAATAAIALAGVPTLSGAASGLLVLDTLAAAVSLLAALLVFGRFRRSSLLVDVILVWAFWTLALGTLLPAFIPSLIEAGDEGVGRRLELAAGVLGSVAVLIAAFFHERSVGWHRSGRVLAVAAGLIAPSLAIAAVALAGEDYGLSAGREWALLVSAAGFGVGALAFTMRGERDGDPLAAWLGAGCVLASMSRLLLAMTTAPASGAMHPADIGRLGFAVFLVVGAVLEIRGYWLGVGVMEERRRIARELHDGMAQELACIVTETRRPDRADAITWYRIARAAERALDESRRAIHALTSPLDQPLDEALVSTAEDVAAREG
ncbi:MAG TPA: histidine kinase dimerization/phosphoacceptor domain-containing protein, partial [Acidimicrobiales bacterium]